MLNKYLVFGALLAFSATIPVSAFANSFGQKLCKEPEYECLKVKSGQSWASLFPDPDTRILVKKVNRMNTPIHAGMTIAVPRNLGSVDLMDLSPLPYKLSGRGHNFVEVDLSDLAWGAYDEEGRLVRWGPISGGKAYCPDVGRSCRTVTGTYTFYRSQGEKCVSSVYPRPTGGAPMPYCMHFYRGFAMHGSPTVPGHHASHGCVRMFTEDARWLNQEFVKVGKTKIRVVP